MRKIAVLYYSMSGNTKELAERVASIMTDSLPSDVSVELIRLSAVKREETPMIDGAYDAYLIGTLYRYVLERLGTLSSSKIVRQEYQCIAKHACLLFRNR